MRNDRRLALRRESLSELGTDELSWIHAANGGPEPTPPVYVIKTLQLDQCFAIGELTYHCSGTC